MQIQQGKSWLQCCALHRALSIGAQSGQNIPNGIEVRPLQYGSVDQLWQSHMLEVHDSMGSNPIGTTNLLLWFVVHCSLSVLDPMYANWQSRGNLKFLGCGFDSLHRDIMWGCSPIGRRRMLQGHCSMGSSPIIPTNDFQC